MDQVIVDSLKAGLLSQAGEQQNSDSDDHPTSSTFTRTVSRFSTRRGSSRLVSRRQSDSASVRGSTVKALPPYQNTSLSPTLFRSRLQIGLLIAIVHCKNGFTQSRSNQSRRKVYRPLTPLALRTQKPKEANLSRWLFASTSEWQVTAEEGLREETRMPT